ncbi:F-box domain containing protein [Pandoravirus salinus]|uniref:F-box domain containing protein n=1 Tax=Pandoravirus salinus TaxID=1349410 RepID=S4VXT7_9VIRU|nr:F-box domain [Pandoravirus salinus]AGO85183.1 F-box domain containing protein [Pandoravirus salinus]
MATAAMITITDLPTEIFFHMATMVKARDVCALGQSCRRLHESTGDAHLWRRLFVRDFGRWYERGLAARPWPRTVPAGVGSWPEAALDLCQVAAAGERVLPQCPLVADLPAPLAHAFAAGKDWPWLYRAHAAAVHAGASTKERGALRNYRRSVKIGDRVRHKTKGYRVKIIYDALDRIVSWREATHAFSRRKGWAVTCSVAARGDMRTWTATCYDRLQGPSRSVKVSECIDGVAVIPMQHEERHGVMRCFSQTAIRPRASTTTADSSRVSSLSARRRAHGPSTPG